MAITPLLRIGTVRITVTPFLRPGAVRMTITPLLSIARWNYCKKNWDSKKCFSAFFISYPVKITVTPRKIHCCDLAGDPQHGLVRIIVTRTGILRTALMPF